MKILWIVLGALGGLICLILLLLLIGKAKIRIVYREKVRVVASILGIRFTLVSDKEKKEEAERDLSRCYNPDRVLKKELRRRKKEAAKALKKKEKAKQKALERAEKKKLKKQKAALTPSPNLIENLNMITALLKHLYRETRGRIGIRIRRMHLCIATGDAAKTAVTYGAVLQCVSYLCQWIETHFTHIRRDSGDMRVVADYTSQKSRVDIDITCSVRLCTAVGIGIAMLTAFRKERSIAMKKAKQRVAEKKAEGAEKAA